MALINWRHSSDRNPHAGRTNRISGKWGGTRNEPATPTNTIAGGLTGSFLVPTLSVSGYIDTLGFFSLVDIWNRRSCSLADFYISMYIHRIRECPPSMAYGMKRKVI